MTIDITKLAQSHELSNKINHRLYGALEFQGTSGEHATITLSIDECKSIIAAMDERLALVEALEKAHQRIAELEDAEQKLCAANVTLDARAELAERQLESRTVKLPKKNIGWDRDEDDCWNNAIDACAESLTAAGIKREAE